MAESTLMKSPVRSATRQRGYIPLPLAYAMYVFVFSYCLISLIAGKAGLLAMRDLAETRSRLEMAVHDLQARNTEKAEYLDRIRKNPEILAMRSRSLGYAGEGEMILLLPEAWKAAFSSASGEEQQTPVLAGDSTGLPDALIKAMAAMMAFIAALASLIIHAAPGKVAAGTSHDSRKRAATLSVLSRNES